MRSLIRPLALLLLAVLATAGLSACGTAKGKGAGDYSEAETEGLFVQTGGLRYQVQGSRELNPLLPSDVTYFQGIEKKDRELGADELWFAVFVLVVNDNERPLPSASEFEIHDTQENVYRPLPLPDDNVFAYQPRDVDASGQVPLPDTAPFERPPRGAMLLFRLKRFSYDNRPLQFLIFGRNSPDEPAEIDLDV
jgi:hypothetical protein